MECPNIWVKTLLNIRISRHYRKIQIFDNQIFGSNIFLIFACHEINLIYRKRSFESIVTKIKNQQYTYRLEVTVGIQGGGKVLGLNVEREPTEDDDDGSPASSRRVPLGRWAATRVYRRLIYIRRFSVLRAGRLAVTEDGKRYYTPRLHRYPS